MCSTTMHWVRLLPGILLGVFLIGGGWGSGGGTSGSLVLAADTPSWAISRTAAGQLQVDSGTEQYGVVTFDYERSDEVVAAAPVGHGLPDDGDIKNRLFYNLLIDGYQGLPPGSCLERSALMDERDPTRDICAVNENQDLLRDWAQGGGHEHYENVLFKNITAENAFRTANVVDGSVVTASSELPHADVFQVYYGGDAAERESANAGWLVIQDSVFRNGATGMMQLGADHTPYQGIVYQNLENGCDDWYREDTLARYRNDQLHFGFIEREPSVICPNQLKASVEGDVWYIDATRDEGTAQAYAGGGDVIVVGEGHETFAVEATAPGSDTCRYRYLEDALSDDDASDGCGDFERPPFLELSCAGWRTVPSGCATTRGALQE